MGLRSSIKTHSKTQKTLKRMIVSVVKIDIRHLRSPSKGPFQVQPPLGILYILNKEMHDSRSNETEPSNIIVSPGRTNDLSGRRAQPEGCGTVTPS
jgi:hypothetical protein